LRITETKNLATEDTENTEKGKSESFFTVKMNCTEDNFKSEQMEKTIFGFNTQKKLF